MPGLLAMATTWNAWLNLSCARPRNDRNKSALLAVNLAAKADGMPGRTPCEEEQRRGQRHMRVRSGQHDGAFEQGGSAWLRDERGAGRVRARYTHTRTADLGDAPASRRVRRICGGRQLSS